MTMTLVTPLYPMYNYYYHRYETGGLQTASTANNQHRKQD